MTRSYASQNPREHHLRRALSDVKHCRNLFIIKLQNIFGCLATQQGKKNVEKSSDFRKTLDGFKPTLQTNSVPVILFTHREKRKNEKGE